MRRLLPLLIVLCLCLAGAEKEKEKKSSDVEILEVTAHRQEGRISLDGRLLGHRAKPIQGIVLLFDFLSSSAGVITTQKYPTGEQMLASGDEISFRAQLRDAPRAVRYRLNAEDWQGHELRVGNAGPYDIE
jgi:hypothetical protein